MKALAVLFMLALVVGIIWLCLWLCGIVAHEFNLSPKGVIAAWVLIALSCGSRISYKD